MTITITLPDTAAARDVALALELLIPEYEERAAVLRDNGTPAADAVAGSQELTAQRLQAIIDQIHAAETAPTVVDADLTAAEIAEASDLTAALAAEPAPLAGTVVDVTIEPGDGHPVQARIVAIDDPEGQPLVGRTWQAQTDADAMAALRRCWSFDDTTIFNRVDADPRNV